MNQSFDKRASFIVWAEKFLRVEQTPIKEDIRHAFLSCSFGEKQLSFPPDGIRVTTGWRIAETRSKGYGLKITEALMAFLVVLSQENPGTIVLYCALLRYVQVKRKYPVIGMDEFANIFPRGYPDDAALNRVWGAQKGHAIGGDFDNLLDHMGEINEI